MHSATCCLPMEVKVRDLNPRLYLGLKLLCKNADFSCLVGMKPTVHQAMFALGQPFVYFDKGLTVTSRRFYERIHARAGLIVSLDEEAGVNPKVWPIKYSAAALDHTDLVCCWGRTQREFILANSASTPPDAIRVTGHPRFDLAKSAFAEFHRQIRQAAGRSDRDYVLINTAFGSANKQLAYDDAFKYAKLLLGDAFDPEYFEARYKYQAIVLDRFVSATRRIAEAVPEQRIVLRPHPIENIEFYLREFQGLDNVEVISEGTAQEWIADARLVIHHDCTTAIEAFIFGQDVYSYVPDLDERAVAENLVNRVPMMISERVTREEDLVDLVMKSRPRDAERLGAIKNTPGVELVRGIIANVDFDAAEVIAAAVDELVRTKLPEGKSNRQDRRRGAREVLDGLKTKLRPLYVRYWNALKGGGDLYRLKARKFPGLSSGEVGQRVELFRRLDPSIPAVTVSQVGESAFLIARR
ncbi:MAG: hypothetical protein KAY24_06190 [Candidatus Eisenbacteria sp.]|nr:hypothetical protein [Candidatus Eisenbacteria bacterium]